MRCSSWMKAGEVYKMEGKIITFRLYAWSEVYTHQLDHHVAAVATARGMDELC